MICQRNFTVFTPSLWISKIYDFQGGFWLLWVFSRVPPRQKKILDKFLDTPLNRSLKSLVWSSMNELGFSTKVTRAFLLQEKMLELSEINTFKPLIHIIYQIKVLRVPLWIGYCHLSLRILTFQELHMICKN